MDVSPEHLVDFVERRRLQNRVAQSKFREKKQREAKNAARQAARLATQVLPPVSSGSSKSSQVEILKYPTSSFTNTPGMLATELPVVNFEQIPVETDLGLDLIGPSFCESNNESFLVPTVDFQSEFVNYDAGLRPTTSHNNNSIPGLIMTINKDGWIGSLHIAAQRGHEQIVRVLLEQSSVDINKADSDGRTPLIHAIVENHKAVVRLLLENGATMATSDCDGRSAFHWAVLYRRIDILQLLLKYREESKMSLNLDTHDNTGWTPLHMAIIRDFEPGVLILIQAGADMNALAKKCPYAENFMSLLER
ncbi:ankyrin repeat-containing domain protein [Penicillium verhagenii]|uniref:ankyrin repeat-containing domain protein n=1 Tax=Penicillium verhagenii TaxID=1562060 RepID=UPI0025459123|nr:ankyrin repeat-containing domain protein [Penicillium verhagenii]KAJ5939635.1 ankyrin repeat-containing domain protein [Penicillium verhagenii]